MDNKKVKTYIVKRPERFYTSIQVEATSEEEAIELARDGYGVELQDATFDDIIWEYEDWYVQEPDN